MDHRWGKRVLVDLPVRISTHRYPVTLGYLSDLSVSGAWVAADLDARILCRIQIALILPHRPRRDAQVIEAYVARKQAGGLGIEWCDFAPRAISELLRDIALRPQRRTRPVGVEVRHRQNHEVAVAP